jgi:transcriptional regulator GlxA family with amidase domain
VSIALDVFRAANALKTRTGGTPPFTLQVGSVDGHPVRTASGLRLGVHGDLASLRECDVFLVPGCWVEGDEAVARFLTRPDVGEVGAALRETVDRGARVGASCTGTFVLADTGMLDHAAATTTWWLAGAFRKRFPRVLLDVTRPLTIDGPLMCAGSVFAMADLALAVVARTAGPSLARSCSQVLLLDEHRSQAPYMVLDHLRVDDPLVRAAEEWVDRHLDEPFGIPELARGIGTSPRTLARRLDAALGLGPSAFVRAARLRVARQLIETSTLPLEQVAARVGYSDVGTLRRMLHRTLGRTPRELRSPSH